MAMTLGRRIAVLVAAVLVALMMAMPTASADHDNGKGIGGGAGADLAIKSATHERNLRGGEIGRQTFIHLIPTRFASYRGLVEA